MSRCPYCKKVPYPAKGEDGEWIWKNVFRVDFFTIIAVGILLALSWAYQHDTAECFEVLENLDDVCLPYCNVIPIEDVADDSIIDWENIGGG